MRQAYRRTWQDGSRSMKNANDWDEAYLLEFIRVGEQESLTLDYKASAGLTKTDKTRNDLSKDVSAFANSAGGFLVYGMLEDKHKPTAIDVGVDRNTITKEWLESVIKSVIQPVVDDRHQADRPPEQGSRQGGDVVQIAPATSRAPHQANDHRYYKRFNFESTPTEDYEVRDLMRRSLEFGKKYGAAWDLNLEIQRLFAAINERGQWTVATTCRVIASSSGSRTPCARQATSSSSWRSQSAKRSPPSSTKLTNSTRRSSSRTLGGGKRRD